MWGEKRMKHSFKIGDRVKILPSAVTIMVARDEVGKTGVITRYCSLTDIMVHMDKIREESGYRVAWCVESTQIELVCKVGEQLVFSFMQQS